jgi:S1-C subfamily serine protease
VSDSETPTQGPENPPAETPAPGGAWPPTNPGGTPPSQSGWTWHSAPGASFAGWTPTPTPEPPRRGRRLLTLGVVPLLLIAAVAIGVGVGHAVWKSTTPLSSQASPGSSSPATIPNFGGSPFGSGGPFGGPSSGGNNSEGAGGPSDVAAIAAKVDPALVDINSTFTYQSTLGAGTGIVLTSNGEVLTNNHVIDGATKISVTDVGNGKTYGATVVGYTPSGDIAVLQLQGASGLQTAKIADSSKLAVGEGIVGIGNAGGSGGTPTSAGGSITGLDRSITAEDDLDGGSEQLNGLIQTNADIVPGDSGGALVNTKGQVIGVDTAASSGFSFQASPNEGFAIPINRALSIAVQIEASRGSSSIHVGATAFLGVLISSEQNAGAFGGAFGGTNGGNSNVSGVPVSSAIPGTAAARAGLSQGDVITSFDGHSISSDSQLTDLILTLHPGNSVPIKWTDSNGQSHSVTVTLGSGPAQ